MGTDIHGRWFTKHSKGFTVNFGPGFYYRWKTESPTTWWDDLFGFKRPSLELQYDPERWPDYQRYRMDFDIERLKSLANDEQFIAINRHLCVFLERNYNLFAVLADVRNGLGFAGIVTGSRIQPISTPRGFDSCPVLNAIKDYEAEEYYPWGDHSFSWVSLRELVNYEWNRERRAVGYISLAEYATLTLNEKPGGWCGDISGLNIQKVSVQEADKILQSGNTPAKDVHVRYEWTEPISGAVGSDVLEAIDFLATHLDLDQTFFVFGFDS